MSSGMKLGTLIQLARPRSGTDRRRMLLMVTSIGLAGAFLLAGWRVKRLGLNGDLTSLDYSSYLQEDGLRTGVLLGAICVAVAAGALAVQALKLGTAARDRRLSTLRLAGATPDQVRRVGAVDAGLAGLLGGLLAGPLYGVLALLIQTLPRLGRVLPPPNVVDLATWPIVAVVLTIVAAIVGGTLRREVITQPLTAAPSKPIRGRAVAIAGGIGIAMIVGSFTLSYDSYDVNPAVGYTKLVLLAAGVMVAAGALARYLVVLAGRRLAAAADPLKLLAGGRLTRTARAAGRTSVLLVICGLATAFSAYGIIGTIAEQQASPYLSSIDDLWFRVTGFGLAAAAAVFIAIVAGVALLAGAIDDLLDQRRQFAYLSIFGVGERHLRRSVRHQLTAVAATATAVGLLAGCVLYYLYATAFETPSLLWTAPIVLVGTAFAWFVTSAASLFLRNHIRDAVNPVNLRTP